MSKDTTKVFGRWLKDLRKTHGWDIEKVVSLFTGLHHSNPWLTSNIRMWEAWESGRLVPSPLQQWNIIVFFLEADLKSLRAEEVPPFKRDSPGIIPEDVREELFKDLFYSSRKEELYKEIILQDPPVPTSPRSKLRAERKEKLIQLFPSRPTYEVMGKALGVSRQRAQQLIVKLGLMDVYKEHMSRHLGTHLTNFHPDPQRRCACGAALGEKEKNIHRCYECNRTHTKRWKEENPEKAKEIARRSKEKHRATLTCSNPLCGKEFLSRLASSRVKYQRKRGQSLFYCSKDCYKAHRLSDDPNKPGKFTRKAPPGLSPQT